MTVWGRAAPRDDILWAGYTRRPDLVPLGLDATIPGGDPGSWAWTDRWHYVDALILDHEASAGWDAPGHLEAALAAGTVEINALGNPCDTWTPTTLEAIQADWEATPG